MWKQSLCRGTIGVHGNVSQRRQELPQRIYVELRMALRRCGKKTDWRGNYAGPMGTRSGDKQDDDGCWSSGEEGNQSAVIPLVITLIVVSGGG